MFDTWPIFGIFQVVLNMEKNFLRHPVCDLCGAAILNEYVMQVSFAKFSNFEFISMQ